MKVYELNDDLPEDVGKQGDDTTEDKGKDAEGVDENDSVA